MTEDGGEWVVWNKTIEVNPESLHDFVNID